MSLGHYCVASLGLQAAEHRERPQPAGEPAVGAVAVGRNVEVRICGAERQVQLLAGCGKGSDVVLILRVRLFLLILAFVFP